MLVRQNSFAIIFSYLNILFLGLALSLLHHTSVQAQEIRTLQDYLNNCIPEDEDESESLPEECDRLRDAHESRPEATESPRETRKRKPQEIAEKSRGISGYAGVVLGVYFPDLDEDRPIFEGNNVETDTGFGTSIFAGINFNRYLGTDLEINVLAGNVDSDLDEDETYTMGGLFLNPRFTLPLNEQNNSLALYISPGIGVSQLSSSVEDEIDVVEDNDSEELDRTTIIEEESRFTWQIKGGVSIPVTSKLSIIPQLRYTSQTGDNGVDYFGTEVGVKFDF